MLQTLGKLSVDARVYKERLCYEKDGTKQNPIFLEGCKAEEPEEIGKFLIGLSNRWKPDKADGEDLKIGELYGFPLFIRQQRETYETGGLFEYRYRNVFYAQSIKTGLKYFWNNGYLNDNNLKLAARYFLNAIDRVEGLKEKYEKSLAELEENIAIFQQLVAKPFEKESELGELKACVSNIEREISIKIQRSQLTKSNGVDEKLVNKKKTSLLPKKRCEEGSKKGLRT